MKRLLMLMMVLLLGVGAPLRADEATDAATKKLDEVAAGLEAMKPGDRTVARKLVMGINEAMKELGKSRERSAEAWKTQYTRAKRLNQDLRNKASQPPPADGNILEATKLLDEVDAGLKTLPPGDVPAANALTKKVNDAVALLKSSKSRRHPSWRKQGMRSDALSRKIQAVLRQRPKPGATKPPAPTPGAAPAGDPSKPLEFQDKRILAQFDKDYARIWPSLQQVGAAELGEPTKAAPYTQKSKTLQDKLERIQNQANPEVQERWEQLRLYQKTLQEKLGQAQKLAPAGPLEFRDKRTLRFFDKDYDRSWRYLSKADPTELQIPKNVASYTRTASSLEAKLKGVKNQAHPEVQKRWEQLRLYQKTLKEKMAKASQGLTKDDEYQLGRFNKRYPEDLKKLRSQRVTILNLDGSTRFDSTVAFQLDVLHKLRNQGHEKVKKALADHEVFKAELQKLKAKCEEMRTKLGDVRAKFKKIQAAFGRGSGYPPQLTDRSAAGIQAFAKAAKAWRPKVLESVKYLQAVKVWSPEYQADVDFGNELRRFLVEKPNQVVKQLERADQTLRRKLDLALEWGPEKESLSTVRRCAWQNDATKFYSRKAYEGIESAGQLKTFQQALMGKVDPKIDQHIVEIKGKIEAFKARVKTQLESERFPKAEADDPALVAIMKKVLKDHGKRLELYRGKRSVKKIEFEENIAVKWDYDFFSAHVVWTLEDGNDYVYSLIFAYYRSGNRVKLGEWVRTESHKLYRILPENISK